MARQKTVYTTTQLIKAFLTEEDRYRRIPSGNLFQSGNALYINCNCSDYCVAVRHKKFILCDYWYGVPRRSFMWALRNCIKGNKYLKLEPMTGWEFIELRGILPWSGPDVDVGEAIALSKTLDLAHDLVNNMRWGTNFYTTLRRLKEEEDKLAAELKRLGLKGKCEITKPFIHTLTQQLGVFIITGKRQEVAR